ncbi:hypothetical protein ACHAXT_013079 [Thalassiosira profunda]
MEECDGSGASGAIGGGAGLELRGSEVGEGSDVGEDDDRGNGEQQTHSSSNGSGSSDGSDDGSYESYSSETESDSGSDRSSDGASYESSSDDSDNSSRASQHSRSSRRGESTRQALTQSAALSSNYSPNRTFHRGVLPILTHGLSPAPRMGNGATDDQNCSPNRSTLIHRRGRPREGSDGTGNTQQRQDLPQCRPENGERNDDRRRSSRHRRRRGKGSRHHSKRSKQLASTSYFVKYICLQTEKRSTQLLVLGFALWILAQGYYFYSLSLRDFFLDSAEELRREFFGMNTRREGPPRRERRQTVHHSDFDHRDMYVQRTPKEMEDLCAQRMKEARAALGTGAGEFDDTAYLRDSGGKGKPGKPNNRRSREGRKKNRDEEGNTPSERLKEGCSTLEWHSYHFPNCNEIHETDMRRVVHHGRRRKANDNATSTPWGYVGNGLWRDVFACDPHGEVARDDNATSHPLPPAVLKIMKSEHPYDVRNFQRHRRDALVMERLSSSHHLVPIYGYCANTVLTQAISHTLDDVIYARENERVKKWSPHGGYKTKPPLESWMGRGEDGELMATRETEIGRIRLALGVFRGLMDLHEGDGTSGEWLPIVHADLQSRQYLVDAETGQVYLNDFNRCRFLAKKDRPTNSTGNGGKASGNSGLESCPIRIPTAPGGSRSPEEYDLLPLTEKLDVYSAGNILYGIITGNRPWNGERGKHIKASIQKGERPEVDEDIRKAEGTVDAELTRLLDRAYEGDPEKRASAKELVRELELLLEAALAGKVPPRRMEGRASLVEQKERKAKKGSKGTT